MNNKVPLIIKNETNTIFKIHFIEESFLKNYDIKHAIEPQETFSGYVDILDNEPLEGKIKCVYRADNISDDKEDLIFNFYSRLWHFEYTGSLFSCLAQVVGDGIEVIIKERKLLKKPNPMSRYLKKIIKYRKRKG